MGAVPLTVACSHVFGDGFAGSFQSGSSVVTRLREMNPHMADDDPVAWPLKLKSLVDSEYKFFRGTADLFYSYAHSSYRDWTDRPDVLVRLHGDVHLGNSGTYRVAGPAFDIQFGLVDMDETIEGPFQVDLLRGLVAVRLAVASDGRTMSGAESADVAGILVKSYRDGLTGVARCGDMERLHPAIAALAAMARKADMAAFVDEFITGDPPRFRVYRGAKGRIKEVMQPIESAERESVVDALWDYVRRRPVNSSGPVYRYADRGELDGDVGDVARWTRIGSSGSQGLRKYLILLRRPFAEPGPLLLQFKEEPPPAAVRAGLIVSCAAGAARAREVAEAHAQLQSATAWMIGWTAIGKRGYLVKTRDPFGGELDERAAAGAAGPGEAAAILGHAIGISHRQALMTSGRLDRFVAILSNIDGLAMQLDERSRELELHLRGLYGALLADDEAHLMVGQAEEFIHSVIRTTQPAPSAAPAAQIAGD